eukprot:TRINITY_DN1986_c0_g1_i2.p1 TRINITY_DN1986_c0_g1~~TRINITY_DN1986_c0_g1_i2.p1  ORF type:complete len:441 (-),score=100.97 TRINITY_DN1986_c0_g1_i2:1002-2288(-)
MRPSVQSAAAVAQMFDLNNIGRRCNKSHSLCTYSILNKDDKDRAKVEYACRGALNPSESRAVASLLSNLIGDALGSPVEFHPVSYKNIRFITGFEDITPWKTGRFTDPGQWTDDASMALCLADSLISKGQFDPVDLRLRFNNWWTYGYNNAFSKCPKHSVGLGGNISLSIREFQVSPGPFTLAGDENTSGNGSLMRNSPSAVFFGKVGSLEEAMEVSRKQSLTTHQGVEASELCRLHTLIIVSAIREAESLEESLLKEEKKEIPAGTTMRAFLDRICAIFKSPHPSVQNLALSKPDLKDGKVDPERNWNWKAEEFIYSPQRTEQNPGYIGSYAMDALAMSLHCLYFSHSYEDALLMSANMRGDADTVCAITGQMAGAVYGCNRIPQSWVEAVERWEVNPGDAALKAYKLYHRECFNQPLLSVPAKQTE